MRLRDARAALAGAAAILLAAPACALAVFDVPVGIEPPEHAFPIRGPHDLGRNPANMFGGGRGHDGQDMFADCGTPVIAATAGTVVRAAFERAAGNYIVLHDHASGEDSVYMHLAHTPRLAEGESVTVGQRIASVGQTGDADGCHLHFELWTAPGWFKGHAYDPLPKLRRWDAESRRAGG
jgi:murein DD-endopeptidase MepM/ murein hydrolase activator NlpD